ncbi:MAG: hypothetical protein AAB403_03595 [Planctomycetota bacterium]
MTATPAPLTRQQQKALHVGFDLIAKSLNDAGLDMRTVLKPEVDIPWTKASVKEYLFRPIMRAMTTKASTTELSKIGEMDAVWETVMRHLGQKFGVEYIPFPSEALGYADTAPLRKDRPKP